MAKAKRLIQSGQVHVLRNGYNNIIGHVVGDHGEYDTEISRDDPESRSITGWQCSCPWDQYAWQRTRKWKKFEGRPCAHVMALYWQALQTPMDEEMDQGQAEGMGTGQALPGGMPAPGEKTEGPGPDSHEHSLPRSFSPEGDIIQGDQLPINQPPEALGGPPGPAQAPLAPPPSGAPPEGPGGPTPPGVLPAFPGAPAPPWAGPGTTPGGGVSPPGAYTVPGAKPPNQPSNPIQNPGTYSRTGADFNAPEVVRLKNDMMGVAEGPVPNQYGDGEYREVPAGTTGEVLSQDASTGWVEAIFALDDSGNHEPFHVRCFLEPKDIEATDQSNAFIQRKTRVAGKLDGIMDSFSEIPGVKYVVPTPNHDISYQPGDRVTREYSNAAPRSEYGLPGEGNICTNTGTVVNVRPPGRYRVDQDVSYDMGNGPGGGRSVAYDQPSYDVRWDLGATPDFSSYYEPGEVGEAIEQHRLWPEGHANVLNSVVSPQSPDTIPEYWPEQYNASARLSPVLGASTHADDAELAFVLQKYAVQLTQPGHKLWFRPSQRPGAEPGRGMIHDPTGTVHTWPESEATHASMIEANQYRGQDCCRFYVQPNGVVSQIMGPSSAFSTIMNADPSLARANGY